MSIICTAAARTASNSSFISRPCPATGPTSSTIRRITSAPLFSNTNYPVAVTCYCSPRRAFRTTFLAIFIAVMAIIGRGSGSAWFGFGRWTRRGAERRLLAAGDRKLLAMMSVLGGLRYGKKELFAERLGAMTLYEVFQDTYLYQEALEEGEARAASCLGLG